MPTSRPAWRRIPVPTRDLIVPGGPTFQSLVGHYLCSVGLSLLSAKHLAGMRRPEPGNERDIAALAGALLQVADDVFRNEWDLDGAGRPAKYRLNRTKLERDMPDRAVWTIEHFRPEKAEARRQGGQHGRNTGVRKGPSPRFTGGLLVPFEHLPPRERKAAFMAAYPCSSSTYHRIWKAHAEFMAERAARSSEPVDTSWMDALLDGSDAQM